MDLKNANQENQNVEAIDLIDETNKIVIQVSATSTKQKIENTLNKKSFEECKKQGYCFKFVSISKPADDLRKMVYKNPWNRLNGREEYLFVKTCLAEPIFDKDKLIKIMLKYSACKKC